MALMTAPPPVSLQFPSARAKPWTVAEAEETLGDDLDYELVDGLLVVKPASTKRHQRASGRLFRWLADAAPADMEVFIELMCIVSDDTMLKPDICVFPRSESHGEHACLLAVEVLSPSTRRFDRTVKARLYADDGVPSYWLVDLDVPSVTVLELKAGEYVEVARAIGDGTVSVTRPFAVSFRPSALVADPTAPAAAGNAPR